MKIITNVLLLAVAVFLTGCNENEHEQRVHVQEEIRSDDLTHNFITRPVGEVFSAIIGEGIEIDRVSTTVNKGGFMEVHVLGHKR